MGIISGGFTDTCGKAKNNFFSTVSVTVPGKVLRWIKSLKQKEIKECLRPENKGYPKQADESDSEEEEFEFSQPTDVSRPENRK